ncbi:hypothetical protein MASR2M66_01260 [Chloroflexota bacterium]
MNTSTSQITRYLILITAGALACFSVASLARFAENPDLAGWIIFYSFLMLIEAAILLFCYFRLNHRQSGIYWLAAIILASNIILPIFDQVKLADVLFILLSGITLWRLLATKSDFLPARAGSPA